MRGLSRLALPLALAMTAAGAGAAEPATNDASKTLLRTAVATVSAANQLPYDLGAIEMLPPLKGFARSHGGHIEVSPIAYGLFKDEAGARALAALLISYVAPPPHVDRKRPGVVENIAAGAAVIGGMALDPHKSRDVNVLDWQEPPHRTADGQAGARMLAMLEKAHGCSGPLVALLAKAVAAPERDPATAQLVYLARRATRDLGRIAYPPDNRCMAGG